VYSGRWLLTFIRNRVPYFLLWSWRDYFPSSGCWLSNRPYNINRKNGSTNRPRGCEKPHLILDNFAEGMCSCKYDSGHGIICAVCRLWFEGSRFKISIGERDCSLLQIVQNGSWAHLASYSMDIGISSRGKCSLSVMLTTHFHLAPTLGINWR